MSYGDISDKVRMNFRQGADAKPRYFRQGADSGDKVRTRVHLISDKVRMMLGSASILCKPGRFLCKLGFFWSMKASESRCFRVNFPFFGEYYSYYLVISDKKRKFPTNCGCRPGCNFKISDKMRKFPTNCGVFP